ncbi:MAG: FCD domain-containing protein [Acidimicrobiia bacterium]|jgi:DNA-binding FadR family transcriptional regulator
MDSSLVTSDDIELGFDVVSVRRAHRDVVDQIVFAIRSGRVRAGDRIPTIEAIASETGVSRPVVGEAVRVLREYGVVESKRGTNGGVSVLTEDIPIDLLRIDGLGGLGLTELVEARRPIDTELSLLAAERATEEELDEMRAAIEDLAAMVQLEGGEFLRIDHRFHYLVARSARNDLLAKFQHQILCSIAVRLAEYGLYHEDRDLVMRAHRGLFVAIEQRDTNSIIEAVGYHWETGAGAFSSAEGYVASDG